MLTIWVEIIMGVFIANFKASEHPVINILVRGFIFIIASFLLGLFICIKDGKEFPFFFTLLVSVTLGLIVTILLFLIEILCNYIFREKK